MSSHNHTLTVVGSMTTCQARCSCKAKSPMGNRGDIEEWMFHHRQLVERAKAQLRGKPSLKTTRDWFRVQADNPENPPDDRLLWRQLADEIDRFVTKRDAPSADQLALW